MDPEETPRNASITAGIQLYKDPSGKRQTGCQLTCLTHAQVQNSGVMIQRCIQAKCVLRALCKETFPCADLQIVKTCENAKLFSCLSAYTLLMILLILVAWFQFFSVEAKMNRIRAFPCFLETISH